jgi:SAM-dependent methyltransferase
MSEFDAMAREYEDMLAQGLGSIGGDGRHFTVLKAEYLLRRAAFVRKPRKILDFGCGIGKLSSMLKQMDPQLRVDGFDPSSQSIEQIPDSLRMQGRFVSDLDQLDADYDLATASNVLHHIAPDDRDAALTHMLDRLAPGGILLIFEHNPANPLTRRVVERCPLDRNAVLLPARETVARLSRLGLSDVTLNYIAFVPPALGFLRGIEPVFKALPLGAQYAAFGTRREGDRR